MTSPINVALIYGSSREGRFCDTVATWIAARIWERDRFAVDMIDPVGIDLPRRHGGEDGGTVAALRERLDRADAFVVVTPEYNHSFPASLKALIDSANQPWHGKPVGFVSYGGISGGLRAVEQLRLVFAELNAVTIRETVSLTNAWEQFDADGAPRHPERLERPVSLLLGQLHWWAVALRNARAAVPFGQMAA